MLQYILLLKTMASIGSRQHYGGRVEAEPLRSKPFSAQDNVVAGQGFSVSDQRISEIKKKYEKLLSKSNRKENEENQFEPGKSVSGFDNFEEGSRLHNRSYMTPTSVKQRQEVREVPKERGRVSSQREPAVRTQVKSQLQSSRQTLSSMKNELQSKLSELASKTIQSSALNRQQTEKPSAQAQSNAYQAVLSKYSKNMLQRTRPIQEERPRARETKRDALQTCKQTSSTYIPRPPSRSMQPEPTHHGRQQLSIISEISNSNNSEGFKDTSYELEEGRHTKTGNGWFKNTESYLQIGQKPQQRNMEFTLQKLQAEDGFSIKRTITEENFTQISKSTLPYKQQLREKNPYQAIQRPAPSYQRALSSYSKAAPSKYEAKYDHKYEPKQEAPKYEQARHDFLKGENKVVSKHDPRENFKCQRYEQLRDTVKTPSQVQGKYEPPRFGEASDNRDIAVSKVTEVTSSKEIQRGMEQNRGEIDKLKEKYNISSTKYSNPYRQTKAERAASAIKSSSKPSNENRSNQLISKEIQKLDMKIKQIEQNKKDLNINFKPYDHVATPQTPLKEGERGDRSKLNLRYQAYLQRIKPIYSEVTLPEIRPTQPAFSIRLTAVEHTRDDDTATERSVSDVTSKSRVSEYINKIELQKRTDSGIEQRKRRLQEKVEMSNSIKSLVKSLGEQAGLDEALRNNKIWFAGEPEDRKWAALKKQLQAVGISLSEQEIKNYFNVEQDENNPFFSVSDHRCNMKTLTASFQQAKSHWQERVAGRYRREDLEKEGLTSARIDCDKKGYIQIEDLVRFLNIESGTFLRNRDLSIIFKRIGRRGSKVVFEDFIAAVSK